MSLIDDPPADDPSGASRERYRVPVGLPLRDDGRREGLVISIIVHALLIALVIVPFMLPSSVIERMQQGAGGPGPAGGGGGGRPGAVSRTVETLRFVRLAPDPVPTPTTIPPVAPTPPVVEPPRPVPEPPVPKAAESSAPVPASPGAAGEAGKGVAPGAGPGTGGGAGSGVGTGRGSANGPGTGGGPQANYPPTVTEMFIPPLPPPANVKGFHFIAEFDVDSTGRVLDVRFTETPNGDYNRRIASVLRATRFRPGTRPDGSPIRMKAQLTYDF